MGKAWSLGHLGPWNQKENTLRNEKKNEKAGAEVAVCPQSVLGSCGEGGPIPHMSSILSVKLVN